MAVVGGGRAYDKVVIMLHGGGASGEVACCFTLFVSSATQRDDNALRLIVRAHTHTHRHTHTTHTIHTPTSAEEWVYNYNQVSRNCEVYS